MYLSSNRSCILLPVSEALPCAFRTFSLMLEACLHSRSRFRSGCVPSSCSSSDKSSAGSRTTTGIGSSRLTKASAVNSSILSVAPYSEGLAGFVWVLCSLEVVCLRRITIRIRGLLLVNVVRYRLR